MAAFRASVSELFAAVAYIEIWARPDGGHEQSRVIIKCSLQAQAFRLAHLLGLPAKPSSGSGSGWGSGSWEIGPLLGLDNLRRGSPCPGTFGPRSLGRGVMLQLASLSC